MANQGTTKSASDQYYDSYAEDAKARRVLIVGSSGTVSKILRMRENLAGSSGSGTDGDVNGFILKDDAPKLESGAVSGNPGIIAVPQNIDDGYIQGFYPPYTVKKGDRFRTTIGCEYGNDSCYVEFRLDYTVSGTSVIKTFWSFRNKHDGLTYNANLDLSSLLGQEVMFILTISSYGAPTDDRAVWGAPMIVNIP